MGVFYEWALLLYVMKDFVFILFIPNRLLELKMVANEYIFNRLERL